MKKILLLAVLTATVSAYHENSHLPEPIGWYVPTLDGKFIWMTKEQFKNKTRRVKRSLGNVQYYLYTNSNRNSPKQLYLKNGRTLSRSFFSKSIPTRVIIHGWQNDYNSEVNTDIRNALLSTGKYNIISVDWSYIARDVNYESSRNAVAGVGLKIAQFLDFLSTKGGMPFKNLGLIGHSLGAHVAGFVGKQVTRGKVNSIIGLDPAYPLFTYNDCSTRLCSTDATYVESIQTSGGLLGFLEPIGQASFYPNGGILQPGCGVDLGGSCSHSLSYQYYAEAVQRNSFKSISCTNFYLAVSNICGNTYSNIRMGTSFGSSGVFYVPVNNKSPYGTG